MHFEVVFFLVHNYFYFVETIFVFSSSQLDTFNYDWHSHFFHKSDTRYFFYSSFFGGSCNICIFFSCEVFPLWRCTRSIAIIGTESSNSVRVHWVHFRANTLDKGMNPFILPLSYGLNNSIDVSLVVVGKLSRKTILDSKPIDRETSNSTPQKILLATKTRSATPSVVRLWTYTLQDSLM